MWAILFLVNQSEAGTTLVHAQSLGIQAVCRVYRGATAQCPTFRRSIAGCSVLLSGHMNKTGAIALRSSPRPTRGRQEIRLQMGGQAAHIAGYESARPPSSRLDSPQGQQCGHAGQCLPQPCMPIQLQAAQHLKAAMLRSSSEITNHNPAAGTSAPRRSQIEVRLLRAPQISM